MGLDYDVIIIGAGISGLNFAYRLQKKLPDLSFCILEGRHEIGGTWSLFKYPGIRSDSDLFTFGFPWRPWDKEHPIASGPSILNYLKDSAAHAGLEKKIKYHHRVQNMSWNSESAAWTLDVSVGGNSEVMLRSRFIFLGTGYYDFNEPLKADISGLDNFQGQVIHPQFWDTNLCYQGQNVVIIGSGATAITLLPTIAKQAAHVTMLQRSPSYILSVSSKGVFEKITRACWPSSLAYRIIRLRWMLTSLLLVTFCRWFPFAARKLLLQATEKQLPEGTQLEPDFVPTYDPWDQRLCMCPDGDFYKCMRDGAASIKTGVIKTITATGIQLTTGEEINADILITATGLKMIVAGGINITVDGKLYNAPDHFIWKTAMLEDLPNVILSWGYVDASWTLGADVTAQLACRLLKQMDRRGAVKIVPRVNPIERRAMKETPLLNLRSTYVQKRNSEMPKCADRPQWRSRSFYWADMARAKWGNIDDGLEWS